MASSMSGPDRAGICWPGSKMYGTPRSRQALAWPIMSSALPGEMMARLSAGSAAAMSSVLEGCFMAPGLNPVIWLSSLSVVM